MKKVMKSNLKPWLYGPNWQGKTITAYPNGEKSYDRIVAKCFLEDGTDLGGEMVKMGFA